MCKKYYFISIVLMFLFGINSIAAVNTIWDNTSGDQNWKNPLNWQFDDTEPQSDPDNPLTLDNSVCYVIPASGFLGANPIVTDPNAVCDWLFLSWHFGDAISDSINVEVNEGGILTTVAIFMRPPVSDINQSKYFSNMFIDSGTVVTGTLVCDGRNLADSADSDGESVIEITGGGTFDIDAIFFNAVVGQNKVNIIDGAMNVITEIQALEGNFIIDIYDGVLTLPGDMRSTVATWVTEGKIMADGDPNQNSIVANYDSDTSRTIVTKSLCPMTVTGWERNEVNLLSDFYNMYNPHVIYEEGEAYPYKMWFFGWAVDQCNTGYSGCDAIYFARSDDLTNWDVYEGGGSWDSAGDPNLWVPVLTADNKYYDQWHNGDPSVVKDGGIYYMAYSATGFDSDGIAAGQGGDTDGYISCVMGATSTDGINWTRSAAPLLIYAPEIGQPDNYGSSVGGIFHRPSLMLDDGQWRLWFDYWAGSNGLALGHAECSIGSDPMDPANWTITHDLSTPLIDIWANPDIVKVGDDYYAYGDPPGSPEWSPGDDPWVSRQIREAVSTDGINWTVGDFMLSDSDTPANQVPEATVLEVGGQSWLYLFYACQIGGDPYNGSYDRIRSMRINVTPLADIDGDNDVDLEDFALFAAQWFGGTCGVTDLDFSGDTDIDDLAIFIESWLFGR